MKDINDFLSARVTTESTEQIDEAARRKADADENIDMSTTNKSKVDKKKGKEDLKKYTGKDAEKNDSDGLFGLSEPVDNDAIEGIDLNSDDNTDSMEDLIDKFDAKEDFFVIGEAGWGKTTVIENLAHKYGYKVMTVYLDKAVATDLGGIPVPVQGKDGSAQQVMAMPMWASIMKNNPDVKFLLFFDEMNQAAPDVQNALMPIVLKHTICGYKFDNFFVGAAGNFDYENDAVAELSGPLKSRFKPIITWVTGDAKSWKSAFKYLHKKYDSKLSKDLVDSLENAAPLFVNPREIEHKIIDYIYEIKNGEGKGRAKTSKILRRLENLSKDDLTRTQKGELATLAETIYDFITDAKKDDEGRSGDSKDTSMAPKSVITAIKQGMTNGFIKTKRDNTFWGISRENIVPVMTAAGACNAEMVERLINKFEADGIKFRYEKDSEWKKEGYKDPLGDD